MSPRGKPQKIKTHHANALAPSPSSTRPQSPVVSDSSSELVTIFRKHPTEVGGLSSTPQTPTSMNSNSSYTSNLDSGSIRISTKSITISGEDSSLLKPSGVVESSPSEAETQFHMEIPKTKLQIPTKERQVPPTISITNVELPKETKIETPKEKKTEKSKETSSKERSRETSKESSKERSKEKEKSIEIKTEKQPETPKESDEKEGEIVVKQVVESFEILHMRQHLTNPRGYFYFSECLREHFAVENLQFWKAIQELQEVPDSSVLQETKRIYETFFSPSSVSEINIPYIKKQRIVKRATANDWTRDMYNDLAADCFKVLTHYWVPHYRPENASSVYYKNFLLERMGQPTLPMPTPGKAGQEIPAF